MAAYAYGAVRQLLSLSGGARLNRRSSAVVLCYHNVVPDEMAGLVGDDSLHLGKSDFAAQIEWLADTFTVVPIGEVVDRLRADRSLGGLAALTFDDGYTGVLRHAIPVVRAAGLPFSLFPVVTSADRPRAFWWDRLGKLDDPRREQCLNSLQGDADQILSDSEDPSDFSDDLLPARWTMLKEALGDDCTIGVHTVTHRNLTTLKPTEVAWEVTHARERLQQELGAVTDVLAYPYGRTSEAVQDAVARAGFRGGLGLDFGLVRRQAPRLNMRRINVPEGISMVSFMCWTSGLKLRNY
jgi:peptidoglycan/xylan/chitin deacetylase (PgdA/CDA1 family)